MSGSVKTVFPGNNSVDGFYSYYESGLTGMDYVFILKGGPGTGKSSLMKQLADAFRNSDHDIEIWRCSSDSRSLDGVLIPDFKTAVIDGTAPHMMDPRYPGVREEIVNLGECWQEDLLKKNKKAIISLTARISEAFDRAYKYMAIAGNADRELLSYRKEDVAIKETMERFLPKMEDEGKYFVRHLFAAAVTPDGMIDLTFELCRNMKTRWFLRGKRGLGQQAYFSALLKQAEMRGVNVEVYHGYLDPSEIVLMVFPSLDLAVAAVENIPSSEIRERDHLVIFHSEKDSDLLEKEKFAEKRRDDAVAAAVAEIARAHSLHDDLEAYYITAMDFEKVAALGKNIAKKITKNI